MSISISLVRTLVEALERSGVEAQTFFERSGFEAAWLDDPEARVDLPRYDALQELALDLSGDPALGLHMGEHAPVAALNVVGHMVAHCRTAREGLDLLFRYHRIVSDCEPSRLIEEGDRATLVYNFPHTTPRCSRLRAEFGATLIFGIARSFVGVEGIDEVWFEHAAPPYAAEYSRIFGGRERFERPHTGFVGARAGLDVSQRHANPQLYAVLQAQAERMLAQLDASQSTARQVEDLIVEHFDNLEPDMSSVARRCGMSVRSLRRRLTEEGVRFADIQARALGRVACAALDEPDTSVQEVAHRLGFSDPTAFHRAFKRWTGTTPGEFLKKRPGRVGRDPD